MTTYDKLLLNQVRVGQGANFILKLALLAKKNNKQNNL